MKISRLAIHNIRCFQEVELELSSGINILIGPNNSGKTTLLSCIGSIQLPNRVNQINRRFGTTDGFVRLWVNGDTTAYDLADTDFLSLETGTQAIVRYSNSNRTGQFNALLDREPSNYIVPYLSKRKVSGYSEGITLNDLGAVTGNLGNLYAKIDRISNSAYQPAHDEYVSACKSILGFQVSAVNSENGKKGAYIIQNDDYISIDAMGEGVASLLGLIVDLCRTKDKLYIIEEPENDIHPKALKALLDLIAKKSESNQFVITTHSNIVLKQLGAVAYSKIFSLKMEFQQGIPTSKVEPLVTSESRRSALEDLGYELGDFDLWSYWLFFEEASAEYFIRRYFIEWYFPKVLGMVRTFSASSVSQVKGKFDDFNRLFVYLHLTPTYLNRACVLVDAGENEAVIIEQLRQKYTPTGWRSDSFQQLDKHDFEEYYPTRFQDEVRSVLDLPKQDKRAAINPAIEII